MKALLITVVCLFALAATGAYASDINFGATGRAAAMGGAGIALGDDSGTTAMLNPAAPAAAGAKFKFIFPGLDFHTVGASFGDLSSAMGKATGGSSSDALDLVSTFANKPTGLTLNAMTGFAGSFGMTIEAQANALITPSPEVPKWIAAGRLLNSGTVPDLQVIQSTINNPRFDKVINDLTVGAPNIALANTDFNIYLNEFNQNFVDANVAYGPGFLIGRGFNTAKGTLWLGTNAKILTCQARRWQIKGTPTGGGIALDAGTGKWTVPMSFDAVEIDANGNPVAAGVDPTIKSTAFKADLGMIYKRTGSIFQYGAVINNFIKPNIKGVTNSQEDMMLSGGIAAVVGRNFIAAADLVNITGANNEKAQLRMGGEFRLGKMFAARAGYSGSAWTYGFEVLGLNIAWAGRSAQLLSNVLKF